MLLHYDADFLGAPRLHDIHYFRLAGRLKVLQTDDEVDLLTADGRAMKGVVVARTGPMAQVQITEIGERRGV